MASKDDEDSKNILNSLSEPDSGKNQEKFCIIGVEKDETGIIIKSAQFKPDILIIDLTLTIKEPELAPIIRRNSPDTAIVVLRENYEDCFLGRAFKAGITGVLLKKDDMDKLAPAVRIINSGGYYFSAALTNKIFSTLFFNDFYDQASGQAYKTNYRIFSPAERKIVTNFANGLSDREIAEYLNFSPGTIRNCMSSIKRKTKLKNRTQIVLYSLAYGLINFDLADFQSKFQCPEISAPE